ncbi:MAG: hypothetical protein WC067_01745 [Candidatus Methanomethylophilaceae archaeon]
MDKYTVLTILIIALISLLAIADLSADSSENSEEKNEYLGLIGNIERTDNGFIFDFTDIEGEVIHCFFNKDICKTDKLQILTGRFSENREIFFVNTIHEY